MAEYWDRVLQSVDKATAKKLIEHIDTKQARLCCRSCGAQAALPTCMSCCCLCASHCKSARQAEASLPRCAQVLGLPQLAEADATAASAGDGEAGGASASPARRGFGGARKGRPPLYSYYVSVKKQHPKSVALVRVSTAWGAGLRPSGHLGPPCACSRDPAAPFINHHRTPLTGG